MIAMTRSECVTNDGLFTLKTLKHWPAVAGKLVGLKLLGLKLLGLKQGRGAIPITSGNATWAKR